MIEILHANFPNLMISKVEWPSGTSDKYDVNDFFLEGKIYFFTLTVKLETENQLGKLELVNDRH